MRSFGGGSIQREPPSFSLEEIDVDFIELVERTNEARNKKPYIANDETVLCFDPGHTTGYAVFQGLELVESGQLVTKPVRTNAVTNIGSVMNFWDPDTVVLEDYRVYQWKAKQHGGSTLTTARVIGCIETFSTIKMVRHVIKQPAHLAKGFCTDSKLKQWGFYKTGERHARDAIRHGCYFLLFGAVNPKDAPNLTVG